MAGALRNLESIATTNKRPAFDKQVLTTSEKKMKLPFSDELQQILQRNSDSDNVFMEMCYLRSRLESQQARYSNNSSELPQFPGFLQEALVSVTGIEHGDLEERCLQLLLEIVRDHGDQKNVTCLLSAEQRVKLSTLMPLLKKWQTGQPSRWQHTISLLLKDNLSPELALRLHNEDILPLYVTLDSILQSNEKCLALTDQLLQISCAKDPDVDVCYKIFSAFSSHLIKKGFPDKKTDDSCLQKAASKIMDGIMTGLIDSAVHAEKFLLPFDMAQHDVLVPHSCLKKFCTHTLSLLIGYRPTMKVSEALKKQKYWKSAKIPDILKSVFKQILIPFETSEVLQILQRILEKQEVNWQILLSCLATFLVCFPKASAGIQEFVSRLLLVSLENNDIENTIVGFLLARQSCMEGAHVFPTYQQWFQDSFGDGAKSVAGTKKSFLFLMKFLTDIVPFEPAGILKAHVLRPPFVPPKCRDVLTDYILLAKTRLADMKVPLEETNSTIYGDKFTSDTTLSSNPGVQDVEKALSAYGSTGKVPITVMEASIFRKPYFVGKFLPALLQPRHLPDVADTRMKFIEALKSAGKIPLSLFSKYEEACEKETRQLLEGVFELDDEDNMDDMLLEPMEQLRLCLAQLSKAVASGNSENKVTEIISILADKIENLLKTEGDKDCERSNVCLVDNCQSNLELKHVQIVDQIMNYVCRTVYASPQADCLWLQQLVRMLSQQKALHKSFFTRFLLLVQNKGMLLSEHHIDGLAMLSVYLQLDGSMFPSICLRAHQSKNKSFLTYILLYLPCSTEQTMIYSSRFLMIYLKTALKYCGKLKTDKKDYRQLLPSCLLKLFCLLVWHLVPKAQPSKGVQVSDVSCQFDKSSIVPDTHDGDLSGRDYVMAAVQAVYTSVEFQQLLQGTEPSLEDWIDFELSIDPSEDALSPFQRGSCQLAMISYFCSRADDRCSLSDCCIMLMEKIATIFTRSYKKCITYKSCSGHLCNLFEPKTYLEDSAKDLLIILSKLVRNLWEKQDDQTIDEEQTVKLWLLEQVQRLTEPVREPTQTTIVPEAIMRMLLCLPPYLFFTNSTLSHVSPDHVNVTIRFVEEFLIPSFAEGGFFSLEIISHLLQGYHIVASQCSEKDVMKPFEEHPIIILSCVVHWSALCSLFPNSRPLSVLLSELPPLLLDTNRYLTDGTLLFAPGSAKKSFVLGATVFAQLLHRNWRTSHPVNKLLQVLMEKDCKALSVLGELVLLFLSDPHMIHGLSAKPETFGPKQWLGEMWQQIPWLLKEAMSSQKQTSQCSRLASFGRESLRHLVILRCMGQMALHKISMDADVVALAVHLCFSLCQVFEEASSFPQHMIQTSDVHEIANTVRQLVTTAPLHILQNLNVNELKVCGLDIFHLQQQRLKTGL